MRIKWKEKKLELEMETRLYGSLCGDIKRPRYLVTWLFWYYRKMEVMQDFEDQW